jgi:hypothetical protein
MPGNTSLIVDQFQTYANAGALLNDLESHSNGHYLEFLPAFAIGTGESFNLLVAYQNTAGGVNIADIDLMSKNFTSSAGADVFSYNFKIVASDLITLTGTTLGSLASHNVHFDLI